MNATTEKNSVQKPLPVRVYSSSGSGFGILSTFKDLFKGFSTAHSLGFRFAERSIRTRYRQSLLGILWAFLPPLATSLIWIILNKSNIITIGDVGVPYPLFVITGTVIWSIFSNAVLAPMQVMQTNKSILVKINFQKESLIFNAFYEILFNTLISLAIIFVFMIIFKVPITFHSLLFLPALILLIVLGMSIGLLLVPFSFLFKDIQFALPTILQFFMYLTPVVYAQASLVGGGQILKLNPVSPVLTSARSWLLDLHTVAPLYQFELIAVCSLFLLMLGIFLQKITMQIIIERMGS